MEVQTIRCCRKYKSTTTMSGAFVTAFTGILDAFTGFAKSNEVPLKSIVAALLLYGVKEFLSIIVFSCPDSNYEVYGYLFIFGPSVLLFCLSLLASTAFWQAVTGCCLLRCRGKRRLWLKARNSLYVAFMPPVIWLIYAFVEENYYVCAKLGPQASALAKANTTAKKEAVNTEFSQMKTESQLIAWGLLLGLVILSTIFVTIYRLCLPVDPKMQGKYAFHDYEADKAVALFNEKVKPLAEQQAQQLIDNLFSKYKDKNGEEQVKVIEDQLKKMFPRHAGKLHGPILDSNKVAPVLASAETELESFAGTTHT